MRPYHFLMLALLLIAGYYIGANYKMNLPVLG